MRPPARRHAGAEALVPFGTRETGGLRAPGSRPGAVQPSQRELGDVGRPVDVIGEVRVPQDAHGEPESDRFGPVGPEGPGSVGEVEVAPCREAQHVGPVVAAVRDEGGAGEGLEGAQPSRPGQVAVRDRHPLRPRTGQALDAGTHRAIEALSGLPHHGGAELRRPPRHALVVAHDGHRQRCARRHHMGRHGADQGDAFGICQRGTESLLGLVERLDGDEDDLGPQPTAGGCHRVPGSRHGRPRHRPSVRARAGDAPSPS